MSCLPAHCFESCCPAPVWQPHLDRTRLCELGEDVFEPEYLRKRGELKALIQGLARPKARGPAAGCGVRCGAVWLERRHACSVCRRGCLPWLASLQALFRPIQHPPHPCLPTAPAVARSHFTHRPPLPAAGPQVVQGKPLDGPGLADLIQQVVEGLNDRDIPTGGRVEGGSSTAPALLPPPPPPRLPPAATGIHCLRCLYCLYCLSALPAAGSLVEYFNKELVQGCKEAYIKQ